MKKETGKIILYKLMNDLEEIEKNRFITERKKAGYLRTKKFWEMVFHIEIVTCNGLSKEVMGAENVHSFKLANNRYEDRTANHSLFPICYS